MRKMLAERYALLGVAFCCL